MLLYLNICHIIICFAQANCCVGVEIKNKKSKEKESELSMLSMSVCLSISLTAKTQWDLIPLQSFSQITGSHRHLFNQTLTFPCSRTSPRVEVDLAEIFPHVSQFMNRRMVEVSSSLTECCLSHDL